VTVCSLRERVCSPVPGLAVAGFAALDFAAADWRVATASAAVTI
jgi:hypothetical protein